MSRYAIFLLLFCAGCQPVGDDPALKTPANTEELGKAPVIWMEPGELSLSSVFDEVHIDVVFSNSTDHLVVLAKNDIDLCENIAFVAQDKLKCAKNKSEILNLGFFNPAGGGPVPDVVRLNPGDTFSKSFEMKSLIPHGINRYRTTDELYVVFFGWPNEYGLGYGVRNFPKELRPYVWRHTVTSMPVRVTIGNK